MYEVSVQSHFSSAHLLRGYKGKCENLHGHNWKVRVNVAKASLGKSGLLIDFHDLKSALKKVVEELDHTYLNQHPYFKKVNPTSENIAKFIFDRLAGNKNLAGLSLRVSVWESENNYAAYYEE